VRLKTFRAFTLAEALDAVHEDLGTEAAILHTRTFKRGGFLGIGGREVVEVIASEQRPETTILAVNGPSPEVAATPSPEPASAVRPPVAARARAAYGVTPETGSPSASTAATDDAAPATSGSLEVDRDRTRKLAQAMAIRLERRQAARQAAGVAGPDDLIGGPTSTPASAPTTESAAAPAAAVARTVESPTPRDRAERYVIGPGGVLMPEGSSAPTTFEAPATSAPAAPAPRVVALETDALVADPGTGMPTATPSTTPSATPSTAPSTAPSNSGGLEVPPSRPQPASDGTELDAIRRTVGRVLVDGGVPFGGDDETTVASELDPLASAYASLVAQELSRDLADRVIASLEDRLDGDARLDPARVRAAMLDEIADLVPTEESLESTRPRDGRPRTIAFVGPTGVGKTTTLAKIAATLVLRDKLRVALITADTYRISAVDQLRTYADILGTEIEVAGDPAAMRDAIARCGDVDAILVDTPGRSQNDVDRLAELRAIVDAARPHETHLVLSGTAGERVLLREAEAFASLGPDRVVLTKLDEAVAFGMLVSVVRRIGRRISWVTTGQEVPRDIERATGSRLADLVLGGAVRA